MGGMHIPYVLLGLSLYFCQSHAARGDVDVYISRLRPTSPTQRTNIYRFSTNNGFHSDWEGVNGMNAFPGDVSYFKARGRPLKIKDERRWWEKIRDAFTPGEEENLVFTKKIYMCESNQHIGGYTYRIQLIKDTDCGARSDEEFSFFVNEDELEGTHRLYYAVCSIPVSYSGNGYSQGQGNGYGQGNGNGHGNGNGQSQEEIVYSRVSTSPEVCLRGHATRHRGHFYVLDLALQCGPPQNLANGHIMSRSTRGGGLVDKVTYKCDLGYYMVGQASLTCSQIGTWRGQLPQCHRVECDRPRAVANGRLVGSSYLYRDFVGYECDEGYELYPKQARIQCLENGQWSDAGAECRRRTCGFPGVIDNGDVLGTTYDYLDHVTFACDLGFRLIGPTEATCLATGSWSKRVPYCERIRCPRLPQMTNGFRTETDSAVGSEVLYQCDQGYTMLGSPTLRCTQRASEGVWNQPPPTCNRITCPEPIAPAHGSIVASDNDYGQEIVFVCDEGYTLQGSDRTTCGKAGWDSVPPTCNVVHCNHPGQPENGQIVSDEADHGPTDFVYNDLVRYACNAGYNLQGSAILRCGANGRWSSETPSCQPVPCPPIGTPLNGAKDGDGAVYGADVTFSCFPGYQLIGSDTSSCQQDGTWSNTQPTCKACAVGFYKTTGDNTPCEQCPPLSTTTSEGSTSPLHCLCHPGTRQTEDGLCQSIECSPLEAPAHGTMSECGSEGGAECRFSCEAGHMLRGSSVRRCTAAGWSGQPAQCLECPADTYQEAGGSGSCLPCPRHTTTGQNGAATATSDCFCKPGYVGPAGGPCQDVDECAENNGGCNQTCTNIEGGHICSCSIPGYKLADDGQSCTLVRSCPSLETTPGHGFLQCQHTPEYNSALCHIKCLPGYFFVSGVNNYVTCGPDTSYEWSHRMVNRTARIAQCTREFFVDVLLPMSFSYKSSVHCNTLPILMSSVNTHITQIVEGLNACQQQCDLRKLNYTCTSVAEATGDSVEQTDIGISFEVLIKNPDENAVSAECDPLCKRKNMRQMLSKAFALKTAVEALVKQTSEELALSALPGTEVKPGSFQFGRPQILCDDGRVLTKNRLCVPCDAGYYLPSRELDTCLPCPVGTYQDKQGQTSCKPCLEGSTTLATASDHPVMCNRRVTEIIVNTTATMEGFNQYAAEEEVSQDQADGILEEVL